MNEYPSFEEIALTYADEDRARAFLEGLRWPEGPICPHCGNLGGYRITAKKPGSKTRKGLVKCKAKDCHKQFTVTVGTIFEDSHIPLSKWLMAIHLMCSSKKGISAHQLYRMLGLRSYQSAWFMAHRIRHAMMQEPLASKLSGTVEVDETYIGGKIRGTRRGRREKPPVVALVQRGGEVRAMHMPQVTEANLREAIRSHVDPSARVMTDGHNNYRDVGEDVAEHQVVAHHRREYVRGEVHTQTVEGYFSLLKRGITGVYHHVGEDHLGRYVDEFSFRYNNRKVSDAERTARAIKATAGKRLTLKQPVAG